MEYDFKKLIDDYVQSELKKGTVFVFRGDVIKNLYKERKVTFEEIRDECNRYYKDGDFDTAFTLDCLLGNINKYPC